MKYDKTILESQFGDWVNLTEAKTQFKSDAEVIDVENEPPKPELKYKLTTTRKKSLKNTWVYQIEALKDIPEIDVKKGNKGEYVAVLQQKLIFNGYSLPHYGIDGDFGSETEKAVKAFQKDHGLTADGVVGKKTWEALNADKAETYTVTIHGLSKSKAETIVKNYGGEMNKE